MKTSATVLQIVPKIPGTLDGVGDYALTVATKLREIHSCDSIFAARQLSSAKTIDGFGSIELDSLVEPESAPNYDHVILHWVNYGYQKRGLPLGLLRVLRRLRAGHQRPLLTIFHELYASAPPWRSAFWLRPLQMRMSRSVARLSDACIVSSEATLAELKRLAPVSKVSVHPVISNFGEPTLALDQIAGRDSQRWVICGGTALVERSIRSFREIASRIPDQFSPRELFVVGGTDNPATRLVIAELGKLRVSYHPQIKREHASEILSSCAFAWVDYFHRPDVAFSAILKSTAFAAACAHGVIPVLPHPGSAVALHGDELPGPYFVDVAQSRLPESPGKVGVEIYEWYRRNASSDHLVSGIARALNLASDAVMQH